MDSPHRDHVHVGSFARGGLIGGRAQTRAAARPERVLTLRQLAALSRRDPRRGAR